MNGINLDIGHFIAGNSKSLVEFLKKCAGRIIHIHPNEMARCVEFCRGALAWHVGQAGSLRRVGSNPLPPDK